MNVVINALTGALTMIKIAVDLKSKLGKLELSIRFNDFLFNREPGCLLANFQITNKSERPINLEPVELHINDHIFKQVPIEEFDDSEGDLLKITVPGRVYDIEKGEVFNYYHRFPFCPYLQFNEMSHGLILIPLDADEIDNIKSLLLRIPVAGYDDRFEYMLNSSKAG